MGAQGVWVATTWPWLLDAADTANDASTYFAAAQRLNAGHALYSLQPSDRSVAFVPQLPGVVLVSHPTIAVLWRPLALLPGDVAMWAWWLTGLVLVLATTWWLIRDGDWIPGIVVIGLALDVTWTALSGNVNAFLVPVFVGVWASSANRRPVIAGSLTALAIGAKLTPIMLLLWLVATRQWRATVTALGLLAVLFLITVAGAGVPAMVDWLQVASRTGGATGFAGGMQGLLPTAGLPPLPFGVIAAAVAGATGLMVIGARHRPHLAFAAAVTGAALTTPLHPGSLALLLPAVAPFAHGRSPAFNVHPGDAFWRRIPTQLTAPAVGWRLRRIGQAAGADAAARSSTHSAPSS